MKAIHDEVNYVLNDSNEININHYIKQAHSLRSEALRNYGAKVTKSIKAGLGHLFSLGHAPKAA